MLKLFDYGEGIGCGYNGRKYCDMDEELVQMLREIINGYFSEEKVLIAGFFRNYYFKIFNLIF